MASRTASKRLIREYKNISENPPPFIVAHPSESNILEWHYILTGPPDTPYHNGQYWGTLTFPPTYPFEPPAIRMHTPSGRFECSTRLCLSISDFHPKSFNPAWEVSTILIGLLSFMTSDEMTTGSVSGTVEQRKEFARRSRWWNSTGGGTSKRGGVSGNGAIKAGDGGEKFRKEWKELDEENWKWMTESKVDSKTGIQATESQACNPTVAALARRGSASGHAIAGAVHGGRVAGEVGHSWIKRNKLLVGGGVVFIYVLIARLLGGDKA